MFWKIYAITLPIFFCIDMIWLVLIAKNFYAKHLGFLMRDQVEWWAAIAFYLLFIGGLVLFVILPAVKATSLQHALLFGALFGLITYATYDLTNLATIDKWPLMVTIVDLAWGTILGAIVSGLSYLIAINMTV